MDTIKDFGKWKILPNNRVDNGSMSIKYPNGVITVFGEPANAVKKTAFLTHAAPDLYKVVEELIESAYYWSEYDVPLGIVDRMKAALDKANGK